MNELIRKLRTTAAKFLDGFSSRPRSKPYETKSVTPDMKAMIEKTAEEEIDCEGAFALMDRYAELIERGEDASAVLPHVYRHIEMCKDCREELETLLRAIHGKKE